MALKCKGVFIVGAKRTPFCSYGGPLRELPASHVFAAAAKEAIRSANVDPNTIDNTVVGNVNFLSQCDGGKTARYCGIYSEVPLDKPALGVSKACGTGLQAIITSAVDILTGAAKMSLTGGTENMSSLPLLVRNVRFGTALGGSYQLEDYITKQYLDTYSGLTLQQMAEEVAKRCGVTREEADEFALQSHLKWKAGYESNVFEDEIAKVTVEIKKKALTVVKDELPRTFIAAEHLSSLPPLTGLSVVTEGNSSSPADGAAALILASSEAVQRHGLKPLARVAGWARVGTDPADAGLAAVPAVRRLLDTVGLSIEDVDLFELNETFASQTLAAARQLQVPLHQCNRHGGAIALGHAPAATGARMVTHLAHQLRQGYIVQVPLHQCNRHGGAIALGHAPAATGARMVTHLAHQLRQGYIVQVPLHQCNRHGGAIALGHAPAATGARVVTHLAHQLRQGYIVQVPLHQCNRHGGAIALGHAPAATGARVVTHLAHQLRQGYIVQVPLHQCNRHGGAIALGHAPAATGARMVTHLAHQLRQGYIVQVPLHQCNRHGGAIALGHAPAATGARVVTHLAHQLRQGYIVQVPLHQCNRHGGAIALGHAPAATGARMVTHLAHQLRQGYIVQVPLHQCNRHGGAIALGHAPAATGARIATHLAHQLSHNNVQRAVAASSCGGGQGVAILLEKV